jgi:hypothetical protein
MSHAALKVNGEPGGIRTHVWRVKGPLPRLLATGSLAGVVGVEPTSFPVNSRARSPRMLHANVVVLGGGIEPPSSRLQGDDLTVDLPKRAVN